MNVVAVETRDAAAVHYALYEIIALHAVLVCGAVREVKEIRRFTERVVLQFPEIREPHPYVIAHGPIVILAFDWI